ncbi:MAG: hypothetical protein M9891_00060 [Austwickia sp.]|nr:hypothetical protein [Austwickia sp.]MCO5307687.1 hypothetical protein [Austwickia sp.]
MTVVAKEMELTFRIPEPGWDPLPQSGGALFSAVRRNARTPFRPTIIVSVLNPGEDGLQAAADSTIESLRAASQHVELLGREMGSESDIARCTQLLECDVETEAGSFRVIQTQVFLDLMVSRQTQTRTMLTVFLTADGADMDEVLPEFERFLSSVQAT